MGGGRVLRAGRGMLREVMGGRGMGKGKGGRKGDRGRGMRMGKMVPVSINGYFITKLI